MKNFLVLTIFLMLGAYGRVVAQDAAAASKRANQQYVLFESERDKGTNVTGMYSYLLDSYENFMKVVEAPDNGQYLSGAKNRLRAMYPYLLNGAVYYSEQKQPSKALDFAAELHGNFIIVVNDNDMSIAENHGGLYQNLKLLRETKGQAACNFFRALGLDYVFVGDGNDTSELIGAFRRVKDSLHPGVVHICTLKGKGYAPA